jgi:hypothetical protein
MEREVLKANHTLVLVGIIVYIQIIKHNGLQILKTRILPPNHS